MRVLEQGGREQGLFARRLSAIFICMSSVTEIEAAMERLSAKELGRLRDWLLSRPALAGAARPKTGAELASIWPRLFHLSLAEADALGADVEAVRTRQSPPRPPAWE